MSAQEQLFNKFKEAFETKNLDSLDPFLTEGMTYETLPPSVGEKMTKAEWKSHSNKLFGALLNPASKLERTNIIERPLLTVVQTEITLFFNVGNFSQGILLVFEFAEEGGVLKIANIVEYMDSYKVKEWKEKLKLASEGGKPPSG